MIFTVAILRVHPQVSLPPYTTHYSPRFQVHSFFLRLLFSEQPLLLSCTSSVITADNLRKILSSHLLPGIRPVQKHSYHISIRFYSVCTTCRGPVVKVHYIVRLFNAEVLTVHCNWRNVQLLNLCMVHLSPLPHTFSLLVALLCPLLSPAPP